MSHLYIGLMSGTSMDGIDVALVDTSGPRHALIDHFTHPYHPALTTELHALCQPGKNEVVRMGQADRAVAQAFAQATQVMLDKHALNSAQIKAIGSHGQTVRHHPDGETGFSTQIGDPNTLAVATGIDVVADFRRKDIALGGQGAPLVPAFHQAMFASPNCDRIVLNIGGISNLTYLPKDSGTPVTGFDCGPGNTLMDAWCLKHTGKAFDQAGQWAAQGKHDADLLQSLLGHPYLHQPPPKSTGRETFNLDWLEHQLSMHPADLSPQTVQATLAVYTCRSIALHINRLEQVEQVYVCGGGAQNDFLMECLENDLYHCDLTTTEALGIHPDAIEAMAFAWLAYAYQHQLNGNIPSVTGASRAAVLGGLYPTK